VLACVVGGVFRDVPAHTIRRLDEIVAQVAVARLGHATVLGLEVTRVGAGPPKAGDLGHGVLGIAEVAWAITLAPSIPLLPLEKALDTADLGADAAGEDGADPWDGSQLRDDGIGFEFGGDPAIDLVDLSFEEADVCQG